MIFIEDVRISEYQITREEFYSDNLISWFPDILL